MNTTTVSLSNFKIGNTPQVAQVLGDIALILAFVLSLPAIFTQAGMIVPPQLTVICTYASFGCVFIKSITKFFGVNDPNGTPVIAVPAGAVASVVTPKL